MRLFGSVVSLLLCFLCVHNRSKYVANLREVSRLRESVVWFRTTVSKSKDTESKAFD